MALLSDQAGSPQAWKQCGVVPAQVKIKSDSASQKVALPVRGDSEKSGLHWHFLTRYLYLSRDSIYCDWRALTIQHETFTKKTEYLVHPHSNMESHHFSIAVRDRIRLLKEQCVPFLVYI
jgi:hypothetical protein